MKITHSKARVGEMEEGGSWLMDLVVMVESMKELGVNS